MGDCFPNFPSVPFMLPSDGRQLSGPSLSEFHKTCESPKEEGVQIYFKGVGSGTSPQRTRTTLKIHVCNLLSEQLRGHLVSGTGSALDSVLAVTYAIDA